MVAIIREMKVKTSLKSIVPDWMLSKSFIQVSVGKMCGATSPASQRCLFPKWLAPLGHFCNTEKIHSISWEPCDHIQGLILQIQLQAGYRAVCTKVVF